MLQEQVGRLVVIDNGTMHGLISKTGLVRFMEIKRLLPPAPEPVSHAEL
jgi:predicted transcriptional regulator